MENYGKTIRKIRLNKGFSQKEIYTGLVSKTYAIEFEKGHHEMSITLFEQVLRRLFLTYKEFLFIHHNYSKDVQSNIIERYAQASNLSDIPALKTLLHEIEHEKNEYFKTIRSLIHINIVGISNQYMEKSAYPQKDVDFLIQFLLRVETWTLSELEIFINGSISFPFELRKVLMETAIKTLDRYKEYDDFYYIYGGLFINFLSDCLTFQEYSLFATYLAYLEKLPQDIELAFLHLVFKYFQSISFYLLENKQTQGIAQLRETLHILQFLGYESFYTQCRDFLREDLKIKEFL